MLLIVNPWATSVSGRLKKLVQYALRGRYDVTAAETEARDHATALTLGAAHEGYDVVVSFGGDGTLNEVVNGLAGSDVPLTILPGGFNNVVCRMLGIPIDVVDATERLLRLADGARPRRIDLARVNGRHFVFSSGVGLDAEVTRWVDAHARLKSRAGYLSYTYAATAGFISRYRGAPPRLVLEADGERVEGVTALVQSSDPYTYLRSRPLHLCDDVTIDSGTLSAMIMKRATMMDTPSMVRRIFSKENRLCGHPQARGFSRITRARVTALPGLDGMPLPFPLEVDGDYIGEYTCAEYAVAPGALTVVA
jgi:diacylglycerol kinase family enzyme